MTDEVNNQTNETSNQPNYVQEVINRLIVQRNDAMSKNAELEAQISMLVSKLQKLEAEQKAGDLFMKDTPETDKVQEEAIN